MVRVGVGIEDLHHVLAEAALFTLTIDVMVVVIGDTMLEIVQDKKGEVVAADEGKFVIVEKDCSCWRLFCLKNIEQNNGWISFAPTK